MHHNYLSNHSEGVFILKQFESNRTHPHCLHVFPRSTLVGYFPALALFLALVIGCVLSRAFHSLRLFPRSALVR